MVCLFTMMCTYATLTPVKARWDLWQFSFTVRLSGRRARPLRRFFIQNPGVRLNLANNSDLGRARQMAQVPGAAPVRAVRVSLGGLPFYPRGKMRGEVSIACVGPIARCCIARDDQGMNFVPAPRLQGLCNVTRQNLFRHRPGNIVTGWSITKSALCPLETCFEFQNLRTILRSEGRS